MEQCELWVALRAADWSGLNGSNHHFALYTKERVSVISFRYQRNDPNDGNLPPSSKEGTKITSSDFTATHVLWYPLYRNSSDLAEPVTGSGWDVYCDDLVSARSDNILKKSIHICSSKS